MNDEMGICKNYNLNLRLSKYEYESIKILSMQKGLCISEIVEILIADLTHSYDCNQYEISNLATRWLECSQLDNDYKQLSLRKSSLLKFLYHIGYSVEQFCKLHDKIINSECETEIEGLLNEYDNIINKFARTMIGDEFDELYLNDEVNLCKRWLNDIQETTLSWYGD